MKQKLTVLVTVFALILPLVLGLAACGGDPGDTDGNGGGGTTVAVTSVSLDKTTLTMDVDDVETLTATVAPGDATDKTVTWSVEPSGIVTVDDGSVTAVAAGTATVTATAGGKSATCTVTVNEQIRGELQFTLDQGGESYSVTGRGTYDFSILYIPGTHNDLPVTSIGEGAFRDWGRITQVVIPDSITRIGDDAFEGCSNLEYTESGDCYYIGNVSDPYALLARADEGISACTIEDGTRFIGNDAFANSDFASVSIPDSVRGIGGTAFYENESLTQITFGSDPSLMYIGENAFSGCVALTSLEIPDSVVTIGSRAFEGCEALASVSIGAGVTEIGAYAFSSDSALKDLRFEQDGELTVIGNYAFNNCFALCSTNLRLPSSLESIGQSAFFACYGLLGITLPESLTSISSGAFSGCNKLVEVYDLSPLTIVPGENGNGGVADNAKYVYTADSVQSALSEDDNGYVFFEYANEKWLIAYFGEDTELSLPTGEAYGLYTHALSMGDYTSIVVPDNVTKINDYAFMSNYRLSSLTVGTGVRLIGKNAFNACPALDLVTFEVSNGWIAASSATATTGETVISPGSMFNDYRNYYLIRK